MEALANEDWNELQILQEKVSKLEHQADRLKHNIREHLPRRFFLPVDRVELDKYLRCQDRMADYTEDFSVILTIRKTKIHPHLMDKFFDFVDQIFQVTGTLLTAAAELQHLAETSFGGAEARSVLERIKDLGKEEWKADKIARSLSSDIYALEKDLDPLTIIFYEKMVLALGDIANEAENAGDMLRTMIVK
jgi:predicted phosphate transport protein (TIGR00153 family)